MPLNHVVQDTNVVVTFYILVQLLACLTLYDTVTAADQGPLSSTLSQSLLKSMFTELVMLSNHLIFCLPLLLLPSVFLSIGVFSNESIFRIRWPKQWNFSNSLSSEYSELISFGIHWFDPLVGQGTLKSLLHRSSKTSVLQHLAFLVQLSHLYMTAGKTSSQQ